MLQIRGKRCRPKRRLMAWSTGAETAAEPHRTEKGAEPHKAHIQENYEIFDFELTEDEMQRMTALDRNERFASY